jgi:hypothetical protein
MAQQRGPIFIKGNYLNLGSTQIDADSHSASILSHLKLRNNRVCDHFVTVSRLSITQGEQ